MNRHLLVALVALTTSGCFQQIRASSRNLIRVSIAPDETEKRVTELFDKRGFHIVDRKGDLLVFKGIRTSATTTQSLSGMRIWSGSTWSDSEAIGSVFYALLMPSDEGTKVLLYGKPTVSGGEACSPQDQELGLVCEELERPINWAGTRSVTGQDEAEVIQGITLELGATVVIDAATAAAAAAGKSCIAQESPHWANASAVEKKALLDQCRN